MRNLKSVNIESFLIRRHSRDVACINDRIYDSVNGDIWHYICGRLYDRTIEGVLIQIHDIFNDKNGSENEEA